MTGDYQEIFESLDPPFDTVDRSLFETSAFAADLSTVSRMWVRTGYDQGIASYLNFFLLKDFIVTHDDAYPPRFASLKSMANSFYRTDLFIRDVTDSGKTPTGGISNPAVQKQLKGIMARHDKLKIPHWMMTYFGFQLMECVEQKTDASPEECQQHLNYISLALRIMGIPFSNDRQTMEGFARAVESKHAGLSPNLEKHARNILLLGEMVGVASDRENILGMLPPATRDVFAPVHAATRPNFLTRSACRLAGRYIVPQAIGDGHEAVPWRPPEDET